MPTYIYNDNGLYYEVDPNTGEMLYTDEAPQNYDPNNPDPTVFTKQVQVGTKNDPNSKYKVWKVNNVYGYNAPTWKDLRAQGYHRTLESFRDKRNAYRTILGGREITDYERMLAQDGQEPVNLTRRDLRREDIRNALLNYEYDDYQKAHAVEDLYFPEMRKIILLGGIKNVNAQPRIRNRSTRQSGTRGTSNSNVSTSKRPCINCTQLQQIATQDNRSSKSRKQRNRTTSKSRGPVILRWEDTRYQDRRAGTYGITKYANQIPVYQTQYAAGVPGSLEEYTERIELTSPAVTTNTTKTSTTQATKSNKKKASSNTSSRTTSSKTTGSKQKAVNTTSSSSLSSAPASSTYSERTWVITKDPNGVEVSRVLKEQLGGLLKYISK